MMVNNKRNILWISPFVPYDNVDHAGGQTHNFFIKGLAAEGHYYIRLVTLAKVREVSRIDLLEYNIDYELAGIYNDPATSVFYKLQYFTEKLTRWSILDKYAGFVKPVIFKGIINVLKRYREENYSPDIIILQWTQVILLISEISSIFPSSKIVSIEEDISYQSFWRKYINEKKLIKRILRKQLYKSLKCKEIDALNQSALVVVNNSKDEELIKNELIKTEILRVMPFYHSYIDVPYVGDTKNVMMYGAMDRMENYTSVIWFIENVWNKLNHNDMKLWVVGSRPDESLMKYQSDRIIITGFVEDVTVYMQHSMCLVVPLIYGAGVKVKILESLSAGVPILTNDVGSEGINMVDGEQYVYCNSPDDYIKAINNIYEGRIDVAEISDKAKNLIYEKYQLRDVISRLDDKIASLLSISEIRCGSKS